MTDASFRIENHGRGQILKLAGDWALGQAPGAEQVCSAIPADCTAVSLDVGELGHWDSSLASALLLLVRHCDTHKIQLDTSAAPPGLQKLLKLAAEVPVADTSKTDRSTGLSDYLLEQIPYFYRRHLARPSPLVARQR
jgi:phospholipid/cholesterol/gamma-HCH transport system permease protein